MEIFVKSTHVIGCLNRLKYIKYKLYVLVEDYSKGINKFY